MTMKDKIIHIKINKDILSIFRPVTDFCDLVQKFLLAFLKLFVLFSHFLQVFPRCVKLLYLKFQHILH